MLQAHKAETKIKTIQAIPKIFVPARVLQKMSLYIECSTDEIGWLGTATMHDNNMILIREVYLVEQQVHATTCELTPDGLAKLAGELIEADPSMETYNNLRFWGHSHVHMAVNPSGQDDEQMKKFKDGGHPWFIRAIGNKRGEMKFDFYDFTTGLVITDVPWELWLGNTTDLKKEIEEEIKAKVSRLTYGGNYYSGNANNGEWKYDYDTKTWKQVKDEDKKKEETQTQGKEEGEGSQAVGKVVTLMKTTNESDTQTTGGTTCSVDSESGYDVVISNFISLYTYFDENDFDYIGQAPTIAQAFYRVKNSLCNSLRLQYIDDLSISDESIHYVLNAVMEYYDESGLKAMFA